MVKLNREVIGLERILSRESPLIENHDEYDQWKVAVTGISKSAGTSFLTGCLARYLANTGKHSPAVVELGKGSLYDSFDGHAICRMGYYLFLRDC
jgi:hypothetical protein